MNPRNHSTGIFFAVLVLAAGIVLWPGEEPDRSDAPGSHRVASEQPASDQGERLDTQMRDLRSREIALAREVAELRERVGELGNSPDLDPADQAAGSRPGLTVAEMEARAEQAMIARLELLEEQMAEEAGDRPEATDAIEQLHQAFAVDSLRRVELSGADCRETMCRLELQFDSLDSRDLDVRMVIHELPWPGEVFMFVGQESLDVQLYLARDGHRLPHVESRTQG